MKESRPLGNLTYDEASLYFDKYCELMGTSVGMREKESRLPTSVERMKEALMVECLNWCNHGKDFDESSDFMLTGCLYLNHFLPDELAERASAKRRKAAIDALGSGDTDTFKDVTEAGQIASELQERRMNQFIAEWGDFVRKYRERYVTHKVVADSASR